MSETAAISMDNSLFKFYNDIIPSGLLRKSYPSRDKCERNAKHTHTHTRRLGDNSIIIQYQRSGISEVFECFSSSRWTSSLSLVRSARVCLSAAQKFIKVFLSRATAISTTKALTKSTKFTSQKISFLTFIAFSILHSVFMILHIQRNKEHTEYNQAVVQRERERKTLGVCLTKLEG